MRVSRYTFPESWIYHFADFCGKEERTYEQWFIEGMMAAENVRLNAQWAKKNTNKLKKTNAKSPGQGHVNRGDHAVCAVANPEVTEPDPAGKGAEQPVASVVPGCTSRLHHVKGFCIPTSPSHEGVHLPAA